jgi:tripartite-type tricarboxylate transporter receptor subunit TctC
MDEETDMTMQAIKLRLKVEMPRVIVFARDRCARILQLEKDACMKRVLAGTLAVCMVAVPGLPEAQSYPSRTIHLIVPFAAGGPTDALGRVIAHSMSATLGKQVAIDNVTGAGGTLARARTAQADADGYTMMLAGLGTATSVTLYRKLPYDPLGAFDTVGLIAKVPMVVIGRKDLPPKDTGELISYIRANKDKVTFGDGGLGSGSQFCGLLLMAALQVKMTVVSYRGSGPAMLDLIGGRIDLLCDQTTTTISQMRGGMVKGYAVTMKTRVPTAPELPTLNEAGLDAFELSNWYGLMVPRGTPRPIVDQLAGALRTGISDATVLKRLDEFGAIPVSPDLATPDAFAAFFRAEVARWAPIIKAQGIYAD